MRARVCVCRCDGFRTFFVSVGSVRAERMGGCKKQPTLPGVVKRLFGTCPVSVCCTETACQKTFTCAADYEREKSVYVRNLEYVPQLLHADDAAQTLTTEKSGKALRGTYEFLTPLPHEHDGAIRDLVRRFHEDTGWYFNDADYKNVVYDGNELKLIDFEHVTCGAPTRKFHMGRKHLKPA